MPIEAKLNIQNGQVEIAFHILSSRCCSYKEDKLCSTAWFDRLMQNQNVIFITGYIYIFFF